MKKNMVIDMSSCKGRTIEQNNTSSFDVLIDKFKRYHRDGELQFAIAELDKVRQKFAMSFGVASSDIDILNEIIESHIIKLKGKKNG